MNSDRVCGGSRNHGADVLCSQVLSCAGANGPLAARRLAGRTRLAAVALDTHIATEWTDGRRRVDAVPALIEALAASLEREVAQLNRLESSEPLYDRIARSMVTLPCVVSPSTNIDGMSAACWSPCWSSVAGISLNLRG